MGFIPSCSCFVVHTLPSRKPASFANFVLVSLMLHLGFACFLYVTTNCELVINTLLLTVQIMKTWFSFPYTFLFTVEKMKTFSQDVNIIHTW